MRTASYRRTFGGVTGSGADLFVFGCDGRKHGSVAITVAQSANLVDKILTAIIVWVLLRQLPLRTTRHFPAGINRTLNAIRLPRLTLWALAATCTTLLLPAQTVLPVYGAAAFLCLLALKSTRRRAKYVTLADAVFRIWAMAGTWRLANRWISGRPRDHGAGYMPLRYGYVCWPAIVSTCGYGCGMCRFGGLFAPCSLHVCRPASLTCSLALCWSSNSSNDNLTIVHEAQRARGVPLDEGWYQRLRAMPALIVPLTQKCA